MLASKSSVPLMTTKKWQLRTYLLIILIASICCTLTATFTTVKKAIEIRKGMYKKIKENSLIKIRVESECENCLRKDWNIKSLVHLWEPPSFPDPEAAFPLSSTLLPEVPLDFLVAPRSLSSALFSSWSALFGAELGAYRKNCHEEREFILWTTGNILQEENT